MTAFPGESRPQGVSAGPTCRMSSTSASETSNGMSAIIVRSKPAESLSRTILAKLVISSWKGTYPNLMFHFLPIAEGLVRPSMMATIAQAAQGRLVGARFGIRTWQAARSSPAGRS